MKLHRTLLAATLCGAFATPALAADDQVALYTVWDLYNSIYVTGDVFAFGRIPVNSESAALVEQDQITAANLSVSPLSSNTASASGNALRDASGNIGLNVAAGVGNAQANDVALSAIDGRNVFASAQLFNNQLTLANASYDIVGQDTAYLTDNALRDASGNIGVNVASGVGNAQTNALAASVNSSGTIAKASADSDQYTVANLGSSEFAHFNDAYLDGNALRGATGNIGVNIAAGVGNAQHNGLAIAVASCGNCD